MLIDHAHHTQQEFYGIRLNKFFNSSIWILFHYIFVLTLIFIAMV